MNDLLAGKVNPYEGEEVVDATSDRLDLSFNNITLVDNVEGNSNNLNPHASFIHFKMKIKPKCVMDMVDTGDTHTFIEVNSASKLGLKFT